jgi:hypothetical protein
MCDSLPTRATPPINNQEQKYHSREDGVNKPDSTPIKYEASIFLATFACSFYNK